jgi:hypothetical protein
MAIPSPKLSRPYRLLDRSAKALRRLGLAFPSLAPASLIAAARRHTGLEDLGESFPWEGLDVLCRSLEDEADLHLLSRVFMRTALVESLETRLRLEQARKQDPELERRPLLPPLIVCGLPRSGTTYLHRLLANLDDSRPLALWELAYPLPGTGPDRRLATMRRRLDQVRWMTPVSLDAQHLVRAELPDECNFLFRGSIGTHVYFSMAPVYRWLDWFLRRDILPAYHDWRALLSVLSVPGKRLVLTCPAHARCLPELFTVLPEALVIRTHRSPVDVLPSHHRLIATLHAATCLHPDVPRMVDADTCYLEAIASRTMAADSDPRVPAGQVFDVDYRALVENPLDVVRRVCQHFGLPWRDEYPDRLAQFMSGHRQRQYGDNPYTCEEYGQSKEEIEGHFKAYIARYQIA